MFLVAFICMFFWVLLHCVAILEIVTIYTQAPTAGV